MGGCNHHQGISTLVLFIVIVSVLIAMHSFIVVHFVEMFYTFESKSDELLYY